MSTFDAPPATNFTNVRAPPGSLKSSNSLIWSSFMRVSTCCVRRPSSGLIWTLRGLLSTSWGVLKRTFTHIPSKKGGSFFGFAVLFPPKCRKRPREGPKGAPYRQNGRQEELWCPQTRCPEADDTKMIVEEHSLTRNVAIKALSVLAC